MNMMNYLSYKYLAEYHILFEMNNQTQLTVTYCTISLKPAYQICR